MRILLGSLLLLSIVLSAAQAGAQPVPYTSASAFHAALTGPAVTADFDAIRPGTPIPSGGTVDGLQVSYDFDGFGLIVTDGAQAGGGGPFPTTSPLGFLGSTDADLLLDGDDLALSFAPSGSFGLYIVSAEEPGLTLFDGDLSLAAGGAVATLDVDAVEATLSDGSRVYFLGVIDPSASFTAARLAGPGGGFFTYNVEDVVTAVPEPSKEAGLLAGLLGLALRKRLARRAANRSTRSSARHPAEGGFSR